MYDRTTRWKKAQKAEALAWKKERTPQPFTDDVRKKNLDYLCKHTTLTEEALKDLRILEIGGPVVERAFIDPNIAPKYVIDPLFPFIRLTGMQEKPCRRIYGIAEQLPLSDKSIDLCFCANTIDHTSSPGIALREIRRVLVDNGELVISCNLIPHWAKPLIPIFNVLDSPHPHHFTMGMFRTLLQEQFEINTQVEEYTIKITSLHNIKGKIAAIIKIKYYYFRCKPKY